MATPTIISGSQAVAGSNQGAEDRRLVREIGNKIWKQGANMAALSWLADQNKEVVGQQNYTILEDCDIPRTTQINNGGGYDASATSIVVDDGSYVRATSDSPHVWLVESTGEHILVTAVSGNALTVIRGYGTTAAATIDDDAVIRRLGSALQEEGRASTSQQTRVGARENYAQFMSLTMAVTSIRQSANTHGTNELERQRSNTRRQWLIDRENSYLFGEPVRDIQGSAPIDSSVVSTRATTGGLQYWIDSGASSNVFDVGGTLSKLDFMYIVGTITQEAPENMGNGETKLVGLGGQRAIAALNMYQFNAVETRSGDKNFGFNTQMITFPFGTVELHQHHLLTDEYEDYLFLVNPNYVGTRVYKGHDITVRDVSQPEEHEMKEEIFAVHGFWLTLPELHGYIRNFRLAA